jgi:hypothetical protein
VGVIMIIPMQFQVHEQRKLLEAKMPRISMFFKQFNKVYSEYPKIKAFQLYHGKRFRAEQVQAKLYHIC